MFGKNSHFDNSTLVGNCLPSRQTDVGVTGIGAEAGLDGAKFLERADALVFRMNAAEAWGMRTSPLQPLRKSVLIDVAFGDSLEAVQSIAGRKGGGGRQG